MVSRNSPNQRAKYIILICSRVHFWGAIGEGTPMAVQTHLTPSYQLFSTQDTTLVCCFGAPNLRGIGIPHYTRPLRALNLHLTPQLGPLTHGAAIF